MVPCDNEWVSVSPRMDLDLCNIDNDIILCITTLRGTNKFFFFNNCADRVFWMVEDKNKCRFEPSGCNKCRSHDFRARLFNLFQRAVSNLVWLISLRKTLSSGALTGDGVILHCLTFPYIYTHIYLAICLGRYYSRANPFQCIYS